MRSAIAVILSSLLVSLASANVLQVPSEYGTIQAGIDAAAEGDTVLVAPGEYHECLLFGSTSISLLSAGGVDVTFLSPDESGYPNVRFTQNGGNSGTIKGFTICNNLGGAAQITAGNSPDFLDCSFENNRGYGAGIGGGIYCRGNNCLIRNCRFIDNAGLAGGGLYLIAAADITVDSCYFEGNRTSGEGAAVGLQSCSTVVFTHNRFVYNDCGVNLNGAISCEYSEGITFRNNVVFGNDYEPHGPVGDPHGVGIYVNAGRDIDICNNIVASNPNAYGIYIYSAVANLRVDYNDVYENSAGEYFNVTPGPGSIAEDPDFVNPAFGEFYLQPTSPCIDVGDPDPAWNDPNGSRSDMGVFYFDQNNDTDGDGILDHLDNCRLASNPDQTDSDNDSRGDACDICPYDPTNDADDDGICDDVDPCLNDPINDADGDGLCTADDPCPNDSLNDGDGDGLCADVDNCPDVANSFQTDTDGDGIGDACDACPNDPLNDEDGDGVCGDIDNCPDSANADQADIDGDGIGDVCDECPADSLNDIDGDGICGDVDDCPYDPLNDEDGDGHCAEVDNCPVINNPDQGDADGDGIGDVCDSCPADSLNDIDGDGICGDVDPCPVDSLNDVDGDGLCAEVDNCPFVNNADQVDGDGDGIGDACDACPADSLNDIDGDGLCADEDPCPIDPDNDIDGDGFCADVDLCPDVYDPDQGDIDGDIVGDSCDVCPEIYDPAQRDRDGNGIGDACCCIINGDCDESGGVTVSDLTALVSGLFCGGRPSCEKAADIDGSGAINVSDLTFYVAYLFQGGPAPPPCPY